MFIALFAIGFRQSLDKKLAQLLQNCSVSREWLIGLHISGIKAVGLCDGLLRRTPGWRSYRHYCALRRKNHYLQHGAVAPSLLCSRTLVLYERWQVALRSYNTGNLMGNGEWHRKDDCGLVSMLWVWPWSSAGNVLEQFCFAYHFFVCFGKQRCAYVGIKIYANSLLAPAGSSLVRYLQ